MARFDDDRLCAWVDAWAPRYDHDHDAQLADLWGREQFDRSAMQRVVAWKFASMPHRRSRAERSLAEESGQTIVDVTSAARRCVDDDAAVRVIRVLKGVGLALGSASLMVMDATRWTVLDVRALASIRAIGYANVPDHAQRLVTWVPYLDACRDLAQRTGSPLRTVDHALFAAKGCSDLPAPDEGH